MKLPKTINLFCETYEIKVVTQEEMSKIDKTEPWGLLIPSKKQIILLENEDMIDTFWHEIGHYFANITSSKDSEAFAQSFSELVRGVYSQIK